MMPHVRRWRIRFLRDGQTVAQVTVATVNRRFARWLALEEFPAGRFAQTKVSREICPVAVPGCNPKDYATAGKFRMR